MARFTPVQRGILFCGGAVLGVLAWGLAGLGLQELGFTESFDPIGVKERKSAPQGLAAFMEQAHWVFALLGALLLPPLVGWLLRPGAERDAA